MFLEVARKAGINLVVFATREFEAADIDDLLAQLEDCELTREERRDYESRLRELRIFEGVTCSLDLAFDHHSRLYVYEVQPDWYEDFLSVEDEIVSRMADEDDVDEGDSLRRLLLQELSQPLKHARSGYFPATNRARLRRYRPRSVLARPPPEFWCTAAWATPPPRAGSSNLRSTTSMIRSPCATCRGLSRACGKPSARGRRS
jgi:hypothetical protein